MVPFRLDLPGQLGSVQTHVTEETAKTTLIAILTAMCVAIGVIVAAVFDKRINRS
jgi:hypothetical protein